MIKAKSERVDNQRDVRKWPSPGLVDTDEDEERRIYGQQQYQHTFQFVPYVTVGFRLGMDGYKSRT